MAHKKIAFFNHKGGVSKTTSVFHIGWMLAELGHKVIVVDCDPQCNLTGLIMSYSPSDSYPFEDELEPLNVRDGLSSAFEARPKALEPVKLQQVKDRPNLYLLPGHIGLAEYESQLAIAHELSSSLTALQNIPGSLSWLFDLTAESIRADYLLIDMSPSLGALNQNLFATSDAFIIPMAPDFFSSMALNSLSRVLPKWIAWSSQASKLKVLQESAYPWPSKTPKYLGSLVQNYRIRSRDGREAAPTRAYQQWFEELKKTKADTLLPELEKAGLLFDARFYSEAKAPPKQFMVEVPDFNSLIAVSQSKSRPVFTLTSRDLGSSGNVAKIQNDSVRRFREIYSMAARKIVTLTR